MTALDHTDRWWRRFWRWVHGSPQPWFTEPVHSNHALPVANPKRVKHE